MAKRPANRPQKRLTFIDIIKGNFLNRDEVKIHYRYFVLVFFLLMLPLFMAIWFAPALVVLHDVDAITAMKQSFKGCLKNILPLIVYGLVCLFVFPILVIITLGFGILVIIPVLFISYYTSYRNVWTDQPLTDNV